jgi:hypothetical protein
MRQADRGYGTPRSCPSRSMDTWTAHRRECRSTGLNGSLSSVDVPFTPLAAARVAHRFTERIASRLGRTCPNAKGDRRGYDGRPEPGL